jgi:hypothetical protein
VAKVATPMGKVATRVPSTGLKMAKLANLREMGDTLDTLDTLDTQAGGGRVPGALGWMVRGCWR